MRSIVQRVYLCVLVLSAVIGLHAQERNNPTLLWRIQKRGIDKPSFLFGTMHVSDKKAFNFPDSLYKYLEQAEAFALEFNPDSANQVIADYMNGVYTAVDDDWSNNIESEDLEKIQKMASKDGKATAFKEDKRGLIGYFVDRLLNNEKKQTESMNTFMDAFLYEMAWQNGKKIFGLEPMEDKAKVLNALSRGLKVKEANGLLERWDPSSDESPVTRLYFKEDIDSIDCFFNDFFEQSALDIFLYDRNQVMVKSIDSIMQNHSLFAAVGSGHLGGAKGVIALLRQKGYTVSPVISPKRIPAAEYPFKNVRRNWQMLKNEEYGLQYHLPGVFKTQPDVSGRKITYHYDIGGGSLFMTIYGRLSAAEAKKNINDIVAAHLDERLRSTGGRVLSKKSITHEGLKGVEAICLYDNNSYARYRELVRDNVFYVLTVAAQKKDNLNSEKAEQYFNSFRSLPIPKPNWSVFSLPQDGFSILLPGKPVTEEDKESGGTATSDYYSWFDASSGINYAFTLTKASAGNYYPESDDFFDYYTDYIKTTTGDEPIITDTVIKGCSGKNFITQSSDSRVKGFVVKRGSVIYYFIAEYEPTAKNTADVDKFLQSFTITPFTQPQWRMEQSPDKNFKAWLPEPVRQKERDSTADYSGDDMIKYYGHDRFASIDYDVYAYPINKFYWAENVDSIYNRWKYEVIKWNDSVASYSTIKNGGLTGRELWLIDKITKSKRRYRLLLNGNTMFVLSAAPPVVHADEKNITRFFEDFRVSKEETPEAILKNTPDKLFAALQSQDSVSFQQAYNALDKVTFVKKDIMLLLEKAMLTYPGNDNIYQTVNDKLLLKVEDLLDADSSADIRERVNNVIYNSYSKPNTTIDSLRFRLLGIVAMGKTGKSYQQIKELLAMKGDRTDFNYRLFGKLYDSLALTKTLYPELLNYVNDTTMDFAVVALTKTMLDSNILASDILLLAKADIVKLAKKTLKSINKEDGEAYDVPDLLALLGYYKQKDTDDLIAAFLKANDVFVKEAAAIALIKNNKPVAGSVMKKIADDNIYRVGLYDELHKLGKDKLFPADYRSQVGLAEGYIVKTIYDEYEDETKPEMIFIKKVEYKYKGVDKVFYIFRANYEYEVAEDEMEVDSTVMIPGIELPPPPSTRVESYWTIAGPFDTDSNKLTIDDKDDITGMWYDDQFDGMKIDYYFRKYMERIKKREEENKKDD